MVHLTNAMNGQTDTQTESQLLIQMQKRREASINHHLAVFDHYSDIHDVREKVRQVTIFFFKHTHERNGKHFKRETRGVRHAFLIEEFT